MTNDDKKRKDEAILAYNYEFAMNSTHYCSNPRITCFNESMKQMVNTMDRISKMYGICMPRYYFFQDVKENYLGRAYRGVGVLQEGCKIEYRMEADRNCAIHEMAHIVCFHLEASHGAKNGLGHGSLFIGILTYLYQRLGHWGDELNSVPKFASANDESDSLEYDFKTLHDAGYLPQDEYTSQNKVKMFLEENTNYGVALSKIKETDLVESCYEWYVYGQERRFTKEEKQTIQERLSGVVDCMEDNTIEGISEYASNCYEFSEGQFKEDPLQHIVDCYFDGITATVFEWISYNEIEIHSSDFETEEWNYEL